MLLTEEEAKTRWCPFVRMSNGPDGSWNTMRDVRDETAYFCRGSACMAWRIGESAKKKVQSVVSGDSAFWVDVAAPEYANRQALEVRDGRGYCGLAGKP